MKDSLENMFFDALRGSQARCVLEHTQRLDVVVEPQVGRSYEGGGTHDTDFSLAPEAELSFGGAQ